jgi:hypothetical protein
MGLAFPASTIGKDLLVKFVNDIPRARVVEQDFAGAGLPEENANASDPQSTKSFQRPSQALDVATIFRETAEGKTHAPLRLRR